ncbi:hypothetical protein C8J57DRAFT_1095181 [Mycena rebaudengoi]|nr:hypothetical protein C8J57DRAFT_1095181 [Mycena rebaudengoi]
MIWDSVDFSCAYDSFFTVLWDLWRENPLLRASQLKDISPELDKLMDGFSAVLSGTSGSTALEDIRDEVRRLLHARSPGKFAYGSSYAGVDEVVLAVLGDRVYGTGVVKCTACGYTVPGRIDTLTSNLLLGRIRSLEEQGRDIFGLSTWLAHHLSKKVQKCPICTRNGVSSQRMTRRTTITAVPPLLCVFLDYSAVQLEAVVNVSCGGAVYPLHLKGIVYHGESHFTSRIIRRDGGIWFHDGIATGKSNNLGWDAGLGDRV